MIDINELRQKVNSTDVVDHIELHANIKPFLSELIDRLEAAESDGLEQARLNGMGGEREAALLSKLEAAEKERDALRTRVGAMEKQEPVAWLHESRRDSDVVTNAVKHVWGKAAVGSMAAYSIPLYTLPVAQPSPSVPNLDMDAFERQNDELKEEVGKLRDALALIADQYEPKCNLLIPSIARSALCATGSYSQTKAQPAPSVPDHKTIRDLLNESGLCAYDREGDLAFMVAATKFAALAAAPKREE